ncbi:PLP-dependent aminotransferase family protein [Pyxidicoccus fallax]|uniref:PLP-dependent aminotransferase family protein n=1 Tax=Pyxidicoccus fallax TaxID=394095 RepID=A0A848L788_9BACT|nr:PLP-dependent aminotransferase family protein [Pyxidicoccus fallax]NMO14850.1 PLP-dependent aminotransferase family protein [Pyxidicoccus fallax]NPC79704.1 PLP-dependent aminotransferase family protein [Pyxidicoccus fallax]
MKKAPSGILPIIAVDRRSSVPLYRQVYEGYREAIVDRRLRAGQRLPSTRSLASELGISRIPILSAFEQLLAEGYFESRVGAGTFVARSLPDEGTPLEARATARGAAEPERPGRRVVSRASEVLSPTGDPWFAGHGPFRLSEPALDQFPFQVWSSLMARHSRNPTRNQLAYGDPMGYRPFREALAEYLRTSRAVRCEPEQLMVVSGSQQALELSARVLLDTGSPVWFEEPGYAGAKDVLTLARARLVPVPVDEDGLDVSAGIARCANARAVYVTPSHQYPLGGTLSASRRLQLLDWARRSGAWILEDDYDSEYRYESQPISALQGLDRDSRVIYIGTFSKVLFPALRVGYLVLPEDLVPRFARVRDAMDIFPPTLFQAVLTDFLAEGHFARHLRKMRQLYRERRTALVDALTRELGDTVEVLGAQAGMHLVAALPERLRDRHIAERAAKEGLRAMPLSTCYLEDATRQGLVLGYGGTDAARIPEAVRRLRRAVR